MLETIDESALFPPHSPTMNRLTAIGLASLVAYGLLIGSKYAGFVSAAREEPSQALVETPQTTAERPLGRALEPLASPRHASMPAPPEGSARAHLAGRDGLSQRA
jgi:hypothetical protein